MIVFLLRCFLQSDVLQERNYGTAQELSVRLFYRRISKCLLVMTQFVAINFTRVIQKVSSHGLLRKKTRIYYKARILPFDVHTVHYFST